MIFSQLSHQLNELHELLQKLSNDQYQQKIQHLSNASIGGHARHIIELLQCAILGYNTGEVNYVDRKRNLVLENDTKAAVIELRYLLDNVIMEDKKLIIVIEETKESGQQQVFTTYYREIVYNTEHAVHHLALIKVALVEMKLEIVNSHFGMAESTIRYIDSLKSA